MFNREFVDKLSRIRSDKLLEESTNYGKLDDDTLVKMSNEGDKRAANTLVARYKKLVYYYANSYYVGTGTSDDLAQEGFIGLTTAIKDYKPGTNKSFKNFAILAIKRNIIDSIRSANAGKNTLNSHARSYNDWDEDILSHQVPGPEKHLIDKEDRKRLVDYLSKNLSTLEKQVLSLYLQGYDQPRIGEIIGKNTKAANNAMVKIRNKVWAYLKKFRESKIANLLSEAISIQDTNLLKESYSYLYGIMKYLK